MSEGICFAGLDVHARKTAAAAVQLGSGEVFKAQIPGSPLEAIELAADTAGSGPRGLRGPADRVRARARWARRWRRGDGLLRRVRFPASPVITPRLIRGMR